MDRGTIVIRQNDKGVIFEVFEPGERAGAKNLAQKLFDGGENPYICVNLQELTESYNWKWKPAAEAPQEGLPCAAIGEHVRAPFYGQRLSDGKWFVIELPSLPRGDDDKFDELVLRPMNERALELAAEIHAALSGKIEGEAPKVQMSDTDWTIIVAALRKQL